MLYKHTDFTDILIKEQIFLEMSVLLGIYTEPEHKLNIVVLSINSP